LAVKITTDDIDDISSVDHLQEMDVMGEPVEQRTGEPLGTEHAVSIPQSRRG
jgi:hypothetical protein